MANNSFIQKVNENQYNSATSRCLLRIAKELNNQPLFDLFIEKLFKRATCSYDKEVTKIYLFNETLCHLNKNEENDKLLPKKVLSIVEKYMKINENRFKNLNETL